jgi:hypothetical protein
MLPRRVSARRSHVLFLELPQYRRLVTQVGVLQRCCSRPAFRETRRPFSLIDSGRTATWSTANPLGRDSEECSVTTNDLCDQETAPLTPKSFIYNRHPYSQAGRHGFESRLPLHVFNHFHTSPNQLLSHLSQSGCPLDSPDPNLLCRPLFGFCAAD